MAGLSVAALPINEKNMKGFIELHVKRDGARVPILINIAHIANFDNRSGYMYFSYKEPRSDYRDGIWPVESYEDIKAKIEEATK